MIIYSDHIWWSYMIIYGDQIRSSYMIFVYNHHYMMIMHGDYIWRSNMMIINDDHIGWSHMMITYDDQIWRLYMIIICDGPIWWSYMSARGRNLFVAAGDRHLTKISIFCKKLIFKMQFYTLMQKSLKTYDKYYQGKIDITIEFLMKKLYFYIYIYIRHRDKF